MCVVFFSGYLFHLSLQVCHCHSSGQWALQGRADVSLSGTKADVPGQQASCPLCLLVSICVSSLV